MHDSDEPTDEPTQIKVTDRRMFDRDGNLREDVAVEPPSAGTDEGTADASGEDASTPTATVDSSVPTEVPPVAAQPAEAQPAEVDSAESQGTPEAAPMRFADEAMMRFIEEQYIGGLLALGAMPEPQTGQIVEDLDLAQIRIEVLGMLQERAGDSLPPEARKGLEDVMYQLRMAYLQKSKVAKL